MERGVYQNSYLNDFMENKNGEISGESLKPERPAKETIRIAGREVNITAGIDKDPYIRVHSSEYGPGEHAAYHLLWMLHQNGVTGEIYKKTMPRLFDYATKPDGSYDSGFIAVSLVEMDRTAAKMGLGNAGGAFTLPAAQKERLFAHAYGRIEATHDLIWNDPAMAAKKEGLIELAKKRYAHLSQMPEAVLEDWE